MTWCCHTATKCQEKIQLIIIFKKAEKMYTKTVKSSPSLIYLYCLAEKQMSERPCQQLIWPQFIYIAVYYIFGVRGFTGLVVQMTSCCRYLRLHFLQQVPSTCTGSESSEQFAGGQKILRHSTTPFCEEIIVIIFYSFSKHQQQTCNSACERTALLAALATKSTLYTSSSSLDVSV